MTSIRGFNITHLQVTVTVYSPLHSRGVEEGEYFSLSARECALIWEKKSVCVHVWMPQPLHFQCHQLTKQISNYLSALAGRESPLGLQIRNWCTNLLTSSSELSLTRFRNTLTLNAKCWASWEREREGARQIKWEREKITASDNSTGSSVWTDRVVTSSRDWITTAVDRPRHPCTSRPIFGTHSMFTDKWTQGGGTSTSEHY